MRIHNTTNQIIVILQSFQYSELWEIQKDKIAFSQTICCFDHTIIRELYHVVRVIYDSIMLFVVMCCLLFTVSVYHQYLDQVLETAEEVR